MGLMDSILSKEHILGNFFPGFDNDKTIISPFALHQIIEQGQGALNLFIFCAQEISIFLGIRTILVRVIRTGIYQDKA